MSIRTIKTAGIFLAALLVPTSIGCGASSGGSGASPSDGGTSLVDTREAEDDAGGKTAEAGSDGGSRRPPVQCESPTPTTVASGDAFDRPAGPIVRLQVVYQGSTMGIQSIAGVDMAIAPSDGPLEAGKNGGHWFVVVDQAQQPLYTRLFNDPSLKETVPGRNPAELRPICDPKFLMMDFPNNPSATAVIVFGSPYGTQEAAEEIARFTIH